MWGAWLPLRHPWAREGGLADPSAEDTDDQVEAQPRKHPPSSPGIPRPGESPGVGAMTPQEGVGGPTL